MDIWAPEKPYVFQSGKYEGKSAEVLMFSDYSFLVWLFEQEIKKNWRGGEKNTLHRHLEWLIEKGENRKTQMLCPQCGRQPVKYFMMVYNHSGDFSVGPEYTCCEQENCRNRLTSMSANESSQLLPFRFSVLYNRGKTDLNRLVQLFKMVFGLPNRLTSRKAFQFFNA